MRNRAIRDSTCFGDLSNEQFRNVPKAELVFCHENQTVVNCRASNQKVERSGASLFPTARQQRS